MSSRRRRRGDSHGLEAEYGNVGLALDPAQHARQRCALFALFAQIRAAIGA